MANIKKVMPLSEKPANEHGKLELVEEQMGRRAGRRGVSFGRGLGLVAVVVAAFASQVGKTLGDTLHLRAGGAIENVKVSAPVGGIRMVDVPGSTALPLGVAEESIEEGGVEIKDFKPMPSTKEANRAWVGAANALRAADGKPSLTKEEERRELSGRPPTIREQGTIPPLERVPLLTEDRQSSQMSASDAQKESKVEAEKRLSPADYLRYGFWVLAGGALTLILGKTALERLPGYHKAKAIRGMHRQKYDSVVAHAQSLFKLGRPKLASELLREVAEGDIRRSNPDRLRRIGELLKEAGYREAGNGYIASADSMRDDS